MVLRAYTRMTEREKREMIVTMDKRRGTYEQTSRHIRKRAVDVVNAKLNIHKNNNQRLHLHSHHKFLACLQKEEFVQFLYNG